LVPLLGQGTAGGTCLWPSPSTTGLIYIYDDALPRQLPRTYMPD